MLDRIQTEITEHITLFQTLKETMLPQVVEIANHLSVALGNGNKILIAGNGGSAADAQHFAAELVGRYMRERRALPAIALTTDTSNLTAIANDYSYDQVFSRQVEGLGVAGDVFIGVSTSGKSENVIRAMRAASSIGIKTVALVGKTGGVMKEIADLAFVAPSDKTPRIQEAHEWILHTWCFLIDEAFA